MQYNPDFINYRPILSDKEKTMCEDLCNLYPLQKFLNDNRNYEEMAVDFVYCSAKIEGNTYGRLDTDNLLRFGITSGGKKYSDAVMIINLRKSFDKIIIADKNISIDMDYVCDTHKILMTELLPSFEQGIIRNSGVRIGATEYKPLSDAVRLKNEMKFILTEAKKFDNVFERAIYLHMNLPYVQCFRDGNKRCARMIQTASLVIGDKLPLFFESSLIDKYLKSVVNYYETGDYRSYVEFFLENYQLTIKDLS